MFRLILGYIFTESTLIMTKFLSLKYLRWAGNGPRGCNGLNVTTLKTAKSSNPTLDSLARDNTSIHIQFSNSSRVVGVSN